MQIQDRVFIVTGGASGLGEGTARMLAANGGKHFRTSSFKEPPNSSVFIRSTFEPFGFDLGNGVGVWRFVKGSITFALVSKVNDPVTRGASSKVLAVQRWVEYFRVWSSVWIRHCEPLPCQLSGNVKGAGFRNAHEGHAQIRR